MDVFPSSAPYSTHPSFIHNYASSEIIDTPNYKISYLTIILHLSSIDEAFKLELKIPCVEPLKSHGLSTYILSTVRVLRH